MTDMKTDREILIRLYHYIKPQGFVFVGAVALYFPVVALLLAQPLVIGAVVSHGFKPGSLDQIYLWAGIYFTVVIAHGLVELCQLYLINHAGLILVQRLRNALFTKIQKLPLAYFDRMPMGRVLTRVTSDVESFSELFYSGAVQIIGDFIFLLGTILMLFLVDFKLSAIAMSLMPLLIVGVLIFRTLTKKAFIWVRSRLSLLNGFLQEYLSGMSVVQQSAQIERALNEFDSHNIDYMQANKRAVLLDASIYSFVDSMSYVTAALVLMGGGYLREMDALEIGTIVAFIEALSRFFLPIREVSSRYAIFQNALVSAGRIFSFLDLPEEGSVTGWQISGAVVNKPQFSNAIKFEKVSFWYDSAHPILNQLSFELKKNEKIALVGHTGAGKSTITKLFTRLYEVSEGRISVDNIDARAFSLPSLRSLFSFVPQEVFLFSGTLRQNLAYGREQVSDEEIYRSLVHCQAQYLIERKGGLDTLVSHRGQNFSLGERQLLTLVRCLIANTPIIILDEATASIDHQTERRLQRATAELFKNRTAVIVAHRLSTVKNCDRILVLQKGRIVEQGSHDELLAYDGLYSRWMLLQERQHLELFCFN